MSTEWDTDEWPIVRARLGAQQTEADIGEYLRHIKDYLERGEPFGLLVSLPAMGRSAPGTARTQMEWVSEHAERMSALMAGLVAVVPPQALERARERIGKLAPYLPVPIAAFDDAEAARAWLQAGLDRLRTGG
jgi:hypothetical protein